jgi:hypothetical protein
MSYQLVTVADKRPSQPYYLFDEMLESLRRFGQKPLILGWGEPWGGLGSKPRLLKKAIDEGAVSAEHIIYFDAFDVVFTTPPELIVELANEFFHNKLVFNAEKNCFPDQSLAEKHPSTSSPWRYLNSGFAVGKTDHMLATLRWVDADNIPNDSRLPDGTGVHPNDQDNFMRAFVSGELPIELDTTAILCQTLCGTTKEELSFGSRDIENVVTGAFPCAIHFNGPAKTDGLAEPILKYLKLR